MNILADISAKQREVMKWLANKWSAQPSHGEVFTINGGANRQGVTCSLRTLKALEKKGFTCVDGTGSWVSTELGRQLFREQPI